MAYCIVWMSWSDVGRESRRRHSDEQYSMLGFGVTICLSQVVQNCKKLVMPNSSSSSFGIIVPSDAALELLQPGPAAFLGDDTGGAAEFEWTWLEAA